MLNDSQHEKLKRLCVIAFDKNRLYDSFQRGDARDDMAEIIDPEHYQNGVYYPHGVKSHAK